MDHPDTFYARTPDGIYLAYQVVGDGPIDFVWQPDWPGNIDMEWEFSSTRAGMTGLAKFGRVIIHDHRGIGLSSRNVPIPTLETRTADALVVLDAIGSSKPILVGILASGAVNAMLAATNPDRIAALVWIDPMPRTAWTQDYAVGSLRGGSRRLSSTRSASGVRMPTGSPSPPPKPCTTTRS